jgi:acetyl esterase/lipase
MPIRQVLALCILGTMVTAASAAEVQYGPGRPPPTIEANGTVHVPAHAVPMSEFLSPEGGAYVTGHLLNMQKPMPSGADSGVPSLIAPYLERQRQLFPVERRDATIGGVHVYDYAPGAGVAPQNRDRVLVNLHGGGFMGCWPGCAELESIPIAAIGRIRVISVDYRQGPKHVHPAASEDVASVYTQLLKQYRPENIGIYGCSAGGMLTGMSVAWFQRHGLPRPGAIGILCAGMTLSPAGFGGDADFTTAAIGEARNPPPIRAPETFDSRRAGLPYFASAAIDDPLVAPASSPAVLAKFPPTLVVTATRGFELSSAVHTHALLVKQGVEADLHVWEGMFHGFFYNPDVPESRDCFDVIVKFFDRHLGREARQKRE